ncbi:hypothetical protein [Thalassococcus sp. S3]|uniref:hypothetical protein n=1 Tax=Thalassococcus sp. S3 TaxID=2017482 RepID=UPI00102405A8|nr:hypothetical protein [Thalassococcus sp. S3]QBF31693.1 hypothetical protein CFI11_10745 [Thalassococcus sp. S3]
MNDVPGPLDHKGRAIAVPAFRTLAWVDGTLKDEATRQAAIDLLDLYEASWSADTLWMRLASDIADQGTAQWDAAAARDWLEKAQEKPVTLRGNGAIVEALQAVGPPHLRIEQRDRRLIFEISVPPDAYEASFADGVITCLTRTPLFCAVQGLGFYIPDALLSLIRHMPQGFRRCRTAIEIPVETARTVLKRAETSHGTGIGAWRDFAEAQGGLPDIGWRSVISKTYRERLPPLADTTFDTDVIVEDINGFLVLTVGARSIWGDVKGHEDLSGYQSVAAYLSPVMAHIGVAQRSLFGAKDHTPEDRQSVADYLYRLLPETAETPGT